MPSPTVTLTLPRDASALGDNADRERMMTFWDVFKATASASLALVASASVVWACTGIMLTGTDGSIVRARTAEWGPFDLETKINIIPRGFNYSAGAMPDGQNGTTWTGRFGMVGISMLDHGAPADGINEAGLTAGLFYLPGFTEYQEYLPDLADNTIPGDLLASYVLSQFETVAEAQAGLGECACRRRCGRNAGVSLSVPHARGRPFRRADCRRVYRRLTDHL